MLVVAVRHVTCRFTPGSRASPPREPTEHTTNDSVENLTQCANVDFRTKHERKDFMPTTITGTMKAVHIHEQGGPEMLRFEDVPRPEPSAHEVLVRVQAAG